MASLLSPRPLILVLEPEVLSKHGVMQALQTQDWGADVVDVSQIPGPLQTDALVAMVVLGFSEDMADNRSRLRRTQQQYPGTVVMGICPRVSYAERCALLDAGVGFLLEKPFFVGECVSAIRAVLRRRDLGAVPPVLDTSDRTEDRPTLR